MSYDKSMNFLIFDGDPNGLIMGELSNWNGRVYKIPRSALPRFRRRSDCQHTGVYFLFGYDQDMNEAVYIGEAERMYRRLRRHVNDREEWNECIAIISKDDYLNKAHAKRLEYDLYQLASQAQRYQVTNSTVPTCSSVSEYDQAMLAEFIDHSKLLVNLLGYKVFEGISIASAPEAANLPMTEYFLTSTRGADARGISVADGFSVLKGSRVVPDTVPSLSKSYFNMRSRLVDGGIIDGQLCFSRDYLFSSPSAAVSIVRGANVNGRTAWKNQDGQTLAAVERMAINRG